MFSNPADDKYAWVRADLADIILLQDFRDSRNLISWKDLLLLLEGDTVRLPAPKNHFATDIVIDKDIPVFATSKGSIRYVGRFNTPDEKEQEMMDSRWKIIKLKHQFQSYEQKQVQPCGRCFAELALMGEL